MQQYETEELFLPKVSSGVRQISSAIRSYSQTKEKPLYAKQ